MDIKYWRGKFVVVRGESSGVHCGTLNDCGGQYVELVNARRLWQWQGAASISQAAMQGVGKPKECKFPCVVTRQCVLDAIEVLECTEAAQASLMGVPVWSE